MKMLTIAAALLIGTAAVAQPVQPGEPPADTQQPQDAEPAAPLPPEPVQEQQPVLEPPQPQPQQPMQVQPPVQPYVSQSMNSSAAAEPLPAARDYPPCSRTVTDNCIQLHERGVGRPR